MFGSNIVLSEQIFNHLVWLCCGFQCGLELLDVFENVLEPLVAGGGAAAAVWWR